MILFGNSTESLPALSFKVGGKMGLNIISSSNCVNLWVMLTGILYSMKQQAHDD